MDRSVSRQNQEVSLEVVALPAGRSPALMVRSCAIYALSISLPSSPAGSFWWRLIETVCARRALDIPSSSSFAHSILLADPAADLGAICHAKHACVGASFLLGLKTLSAQTVNSKFEGCCCWCARVHIHLIFSSALRWALRDMCAVRLKWSNCCARHCAFYPFLFLFIGVILDLTVKGNKLSM